MPSPTLQKKIEGIKWEFPQPLQPTNFCSLSSYFSIVTIDVSLFYLRPSPPIFTLYPITSLISGTSVILVKIIVVPVADKPGKLIGLIKYINVSLRSNPVGIMRWEWKLLCSLQTWANIGSFFFSVRFPVFPWAKGYPASRWGQGEKIMLESLYGSDLETDQNPGPWPLLTRQESEKCILFACPRRKKIANM